MGNRECCFIFLLLTSQKRFPDASYKLIPYNRVKNFMMVTQHLNPLKADMSPEDRELLNSDFAIVCVQVKQKRSGALGGKALKQPVSFFSQFPSFLETWLLGSLEVLPAA